MPSFLASTTFATSVFAYSTLLAFAVLKLSNDLSQTLHVLIPIESAAALTTQAAGPPTSTIGFSKSILESLSACKISFDSFA